MKLIAIKSTITSILITGVISLNSCKHDPIFPASEAATVSFQLDIQPIIVSNCTMQGCHPNMGSYSNLMHDVHAGRPNSSELYEVITTNDMDDRMPMAPNPRLSDEQIQLIYLWIAQGAQNN